MARTTTAIAVPAPAGPITRILETVDRWRLRRYAAALAHSEADLAARELTYHFHVETGEGPDGAYLADEAYADWCDAYGMHRDRFGDTSPAPTRPARHPADPNTVTA